MILRKKNRDEPRIEYVPLIDCLLLLLIFFMSTTHFITQPALTVDLPAARSAAMVTVSGRIEIVVDGVGDIFVDGRPVALERLGETLRGLTRDPESTVVLIKSDVNVAYGHIVAVMDAVRGQGLKRMVLATRLKDVAG